MFAVCVSFTVKPDALATFLPLVLGNAHTSLREEAECHRFDVCQDPKHPENIFLYEVYTDEAAFGAHLTSEHFQSFDAAVRDMVAAKDVKTYSLL